MLVIGHRGAAGEAPENTVAAIERGIADGADIVEFDVRLTRDSVPVISHDPHLLRSHRKTSVISTLTLDEVRAMTADTKHPIATLDEVLTLTVGRIYVNIEIKTAGSVTPTLAIVKKYYSTKKAQGSEILFSSFKPKVLRRIKTIWPHAQIGFLNGVNPQRFMAWAKQLNLSAVGFHRLHCNTFALEVAQKLDLFTYVYTINRVDAARRFYDRDVDAIVTNFPGKMVKYVEKMEKER